jgi:hypothetical protein
MVLPPPARDLVLCLCEVGWLYSKIETYIRTVDNAETKGLIAQALGYSLQVLFRPAVKIVLLML